MLRIAVFISVLLLHGLILWFLWQIAPLMAQQISKPVQVLNIEFISVQAQSSDVELVAELEPADHAPVSPYRAPSAQAQVQKQLAVENQQAQAKEIISTTPAQIKEQVKEQIKKTMDVTQSITHSATQNKTMPNPEAHSVPHVNDNPPAKALANDDKAPHRPTQSSTASASTDVVSDAKTDVAKAQTQAMAQNTTFGNQSAKDNQSAKEHTTGGEIKATQNEQGAVSSNPVQATGNLPRPPYPPISEENQEEGVVMLKVLVAPNGKVEKVTIAKSSGFVRLDNAAKNAAYQGSFKTNVWTEYHIAIEFRL